MKSTFIEIYTILKTEFEPSVKVFTGIAPAKEAEQFPYMVLNQNLTAATTYHSSGDVIEDRSFILTIYDTSNIKATEILEQAETLFEGATYTLDSGSVMAPFKETDDIDIAPEKTSDGFEVWLATLIYRFMVQRPLT